MPTQEAKQQNEEEKERLEDVITSNRKAREQFEAEALRWADLKDRNP